MIQNIARGYADSVISGKPDILTVDELSDLLKATSQTIYNMIAARGGDVSQKDFNMDSVSSL